MVFRSFFQGVTHKSVMNRIFLLAAILMCSAIVSNAQDWEVVREESFQSYSLSGLDSYNCFNPSGYGASGVTLDYCAVSLGQNPACYIAIKENLSANYEYRLSINTKVQAQTPALEGTPSGRSMQFSYSSGATLPPTAGATLISGNHPIPFRILTNPGEDVTGDVFTVADGSYWLIAGFSTLLAGNTMITFDNYVLERRLLSVTIPDFILTLSGSNEPITGLTISPGETTQLCLTPETAPELDITLTISPNGAGTPHFEGYSSNLVFPEGLTSSQCFTLNPSVDNSMMNYTFDVITEDGDNITSFSVLVEESCTDIAGPDVEICEGSSVQIGTGCLPSPHPISGVEYCYSWQPEEGLTTSDGSPIGPEESMPFASPDETTLYTVYVTNSEGEFVGQDQVTILIEDITDLSISPDNPTLCQNDENVLLEALIWASEGEYSFEWSNGESGRFLQVTETGTYSVTATENISGCTVSASVNVENGGFDYNLIAPDYWCTGLEPTIYINGIDDGSDYIYEWSTGDTFTDEIQVNDAGTYSVTVQNLTTSCELSKEVDLIEMGIDIVITPEVPVICPGGFVELKVIGEYSSIVWETKNNDGDYEIFASGTEVTINESHLVNSPVIQVEVVTTDGCEAVSEIEVKNIDTSPESIKTLFLSKGFYCIDINVLGDETLVTPDSRNPSSFCEEACIDPTFEGACVRDDAQKLIEIKSVELPSVYNAVLENLSYFESEFGYSYSRGFISKNENLCSCTNLDYFEKIENAFEASELAFWMHIYEDPNGEEDKLFILANVPSSDIHFPATGEQISLLDEMLAYVESDDELGNFTNKAERIMFTAQDVLLDNHVSVKTFTNDLSSSFAVPCESAPVTDAIGISPAGFPIQLPSNAILRFGKTQQWIGEMPDGALSGFTALSANNLLAKYYNARSNYSGEYFRGYYQMTIRGTFLQTTPYMSPIIPANQYPFYVPIRMGNQIQEGENTYYELYTGKYICELPTSVITGAGPILNTFDDCLDGIVDEGTYDISLPSISEADFISGEDNTLYNWNDGVLIRVNNEEGYTQYIYGSLNTETEDDPYDFIYYIWNCLTGEWNPLLPENISGAIADGIGAAYLLSNNDGTNGTDGDESLEIPECFFLSASETKNFEFTGTPGSNGEGITDYIGIDADELARIQSAINAANSRFNLAVEVIVSGDGESLEGMPNNSNSGSEAYSLFNDLNTLDGLDVLFWVHYQNNGSATFCLKFSENYFTTDNSNYTIPIDEKYETKDVLLDALNVGIRKDEFQLIDSSPYVDEDDPDNSPSTQSAWKFGLRDGYEDEVNMYGIAKAITGIGRETIRALEIPESVWHPNGVCMMDSPGVVIGPGNAVIGENPLVGIAQGVSFGVSCFQDEEVRKGLLNVIKHPGKLVRGMVEEKYNNYANFLENPDDPEAFEVMTYHAGFDGTSVIIAIVTGAGLTAVGDFLSGLSKKAKDAAESLKKKIDEAPESLSDEFYLEFEAPNFDEALEEAFLEFFQDMGEHYPKLTKRPEMVRVWKGLKDLPDVNMELVLKKFPDPSNADFYDNLQTTLFKADGTLEVDVNGDFVAASFFKDVEGSGDDFLNKFTDASSGARSFDSWEVIYGDDLLRKSPENIEDVTTYLDDYAEYLGGLDPPQNLDLQNVKTEFDDLPQTEKLPWVKFVKYRTFGKRVKRAGNRPHSDFTSFNSLSDVPNRYSSDPRFTDDYEPSNLSYDPAENKVNGDTRKEAIAGLEAENQELIVSPIQRDADGGAEFIAGDNSLWDVKTPPGMFFDQNFPGGSIVEQLNAPGIDVILDCTYLNDDQLQTLRTWLETELASTPEKLERIIEINTNLY